MLYVGVDDHKSTSQITVMNEAGEILRWKSVNSTKEGFQEALAGYDEPFKAVLEASYIWGPMYDWLDDMSEESCSPILSRFERLLPHGSRMTGLLRSAGSVANSINCPE